MSRFFRGGDDSSTESGSSDEEELYSEEEEEEEKPQVQSEEEASEEEEDEDEDSDEDSSDDEGGRKQGAARFLRGDSSESEDSGAEDRVKVKSAKDKRHDELEAVVKAIENGQKINDWGSISNGKPKQRQRRKQPQY